MDAITKTIEQVREYDAITSAGVLEQFLEGTIHKDFLNELALRIETMRDLNESCDSKMYLETRGGIKALRMVSNIFHDLLQNSLDQIEKKENDHGR